jgi:serine phosphatase RsbU (regulator of sigma subunit)
MPKKLICFTPDELKAAKAKRHERAEERAMTKYREGVIDGREQERENYNSILAAALFQLLAREPGQIEAEVEIARSLSKSIGVSIKISGKDKVTIRLNVKAYMPE